MKLGIFSLIGLLTFGSCKRENGVGGVIMEVGINLHIVDKSENNLLKDNQLIDGLRLFYIVDGKEAEVYDPNMQAERNFSILKFEGDGKYSGEPLMKVVANTIDQGSVTKTILKWSNGTVDTLATEMTRKGASLWIKNIWLNSDLVWSPEIGKEKYENGEIKGLSRLIKLVK